MRGVVFLSYAREDSAYLRELRDYLLECGIPAWADSAIEPSMRWHHELDEVIRSAASVIVVMSPAAADSRWVDEEIRRARKFRRPIFPVLTEGEVLGSLADIQYDDVRTGPRLPSDKFLRRLRSEIARQQRRAGDRARTASVLANVPRPDRLYGRADVLTRLLEDLLNHPTGRVIDFIGLGGTGKRSLVRVLAEMVGFDYEAVHWVSLLEGEKPDDYVPEILSSNGPAVDDEAGDPAKSLVELLDRRSMLVVFDHVDATFGVNVETHVRADHERVFRAVRSHPGKSALLFTSRMALPFSDPDLLEEILGLDVNAVELLLRKNGYDFSHETAARLVEHYGGNPLAILLAAPVLELKGGAIEEFLSSPEALPRELSNLARSQLSFLRADEKLCVQYLAFARQGGDIPELADVLSAGLRRREGAARGSPSESPARILTRLERHIWMSTGVAGVLAPAFAEAVVSNTIEDIAAELDEGVLDGLSRLPLINPVAADQVLATQRRSQVRQLVRALEDGGDIGDRLRQLVDRARQEASGSFALGNLLTLLIQTEKTIRDLDVAGGDVRNVDFREAQLHGSSFRKVSFRRARFRQSFEGIICLKFNPDGSEVVAGTANGQLLAWSSMTGELVAIHEGHTDVVTAVDFTSNGEFLVSSSDDGTARVWHTRSRKLVHVLRDGEQGFHTVACGPGGDLVAAGGGAGDVRMWRVRAGVLATRLELGAGEVRSVGFSPDGLWFAAGYSDHRARIWKMPQMRLRFETDDHGSAIEAVYFEPRSGLLMTHAPETKSTSWWDPAAESEVGSPVPFIPPTARLSFSIGGELAASALHPHRIEVWSCQGEHRIRSFPSPRHRMQACAVSSVRGLVAAGGDSHAIAVWEVDSGRSKWVERGHSRWIKAIDFSPDGALVACCADDERIHVWETATGRSRVERAPHEGHIRQICFVSRARQRSVVSASDDGRAILWDVDSDQLRCYGPHSSGVWTVAVTRDGERLAAGLLDGGIQLWSLRSGERQLELRGHEAGAVRSLSFSANGHMLASGGDDGKVRIWDLTGESDVAETVCHGHAGRIWAVRFCPETRGGARVVASAGQDGSIRLWSAESGVQLANVQSPHGTVWAIAFRPDGRELASGASDRRIRLWRLHTKRGATGSVELRERTILDGHEDWVRALAYSPSGDVLGSGSHDGTLRLWNLRDGPACRLLPVLRPYEAADFRDAVGLSEPQLSTLRRLGAVTS